MRHTHLRWLIAAVAILASLGTTLLAGPALPSALAASNRPQDYLAVGNSVDCGFNPVRDKSNAEKLIGCPTPVAAALKETLTNPSCPGETSSHFISLAGSDNSCGAYRQNFPLHVAYGTSQLEFADGFLQSHPMTLVVSIDIGANDLFVLENACGGPTNVNCILAGLPGMLATLSANLDTIYGHIRNLDGYTHKLVALTYYSLNYSDPVGTKAISQVKQAEAPRTLTVRGICADGIGAFAAASTP